MSQVSATPAPIIVATTIPVTLFEIVEVARSAAAPVAAPVIARTEVYVAHFR